MIKRIRGSESTPSLNLFEQFVKKRNENTCVLQSQHESINVKVNCFQELIRLTKTGSLMPRPQTSVPTQQKNAVSFNNQVQVHHQLRQDDENTEEMMINLSRMASDLNGWVGAKAELRHQSCKAEEILANFEKKGQPLRAKSSKKFKHAHSNSTNISRLIQKNIATKKQKITRPQFYLGNFINPYNRKNKVTLSKASQVLKKANTKIELSTPILVNQKQHNFQKLKEKIVQLQNTAKLRYGMKFDYQNNTESKVPIPQHENQEFAQPARQLFKDRQYQYKVGVKNYKKLVNEHIKQDSSIPSQLLGIIKSRSYKNGRPMSREGHASRFIRI